MSRPSNDDFVSMARATSSKEKLPWNGQWIFNSKREMVDFARAVADAAIAADRAARPKPIAWATPAGIAAIHAARLGRADNVQVPLSTYPGGDHSVAVYTTPPAAPVVPEGWKPVLEAVMREMPKAARYYRLDDGNAPGHAHKVAGIWDSDNGDLAGKPCAWCLAWNTARAMLAAAPAPRQEPTT